MKKKFSLPFRKKIIQLSWEYHVEKRPLPDYLDEKSGLRRGVITSRTEPKSDMPSNVVPYCSEDELDGSFEWLFNLPRCSYKYLYNQFAQEGVFNEEEIHNEWEYESYSLKNAINPVKIFITTPGQVNTLRK